MTVEVESILTALEAVKLGHVDVEVFMNSETVIQFMSRITDLPASTAAKAIDALFSRDVLKKPLKNVPRTIVDGLFACLRRHSTVLEQILTAVGNLTDDEDPSQTWLVTEYDAINLIVAELKRTVTLPNVQLKAYYALQKLVVGHEANIRLLFHGHRIHELIETLAINYPLYAPLITQVCALLRRISFLDSADEALVVTSCRRVLNAMLTFPMETELLEHGCAFINNVARAEPRKRLLVSAPYFAHEVVLQAMRTHPFSTDVQEKGCGACWNLASDPQNCKTLVLAPHLLHEVVLAAMRQHPNNAIIQERGCGTLWNLACDDANKSMLTCEPYLAHELILAAMRTFVRNASVQEKACGALWNILVDADNKVLLAESPHLVHQAILTAMQVHLQHPEVQHNGCGALSNLVANNEKNKILLTKCDGHITVAAALRSHPTSKEVQLQGIWVLASLSYEQSNRKILLNHEVLALCHLAQRAFPNNDKLNNEINILEENLGVV